MRTITILQSLTRMTRSAQWCCSEMLQKVHEGNMALVLWWGHGTDGIMNRIKLPTSGGQKETIWHSWKS